LEHCREEGEHGRERQHDEEGVAKTQCATWSFGEEIEEGKKVKMSRKKLKEQIQDEKRSSKMYRKAGYPQIAKDETRHRKILERDLKRMKK
jgi:hypothetical protein